MHVYYKWTRSSARPCIPWQKKATSDFSVLLNKRERTKKAGILVYLTGEKAAATAVQCSVPSTFLPPAQSPEPE